MGQKELPKKSHRTSGAVRIAGGIQSKNMLSLGTRPGEQPHLISSNRRFDSVRRQRGARSNSRLRPDPSFILNRYFSGHPTNTTLSRHPLPPSCTWISSRLYCIFINSILTSSADSLRSPTILTLSSF